MKYINSNLKKGFTIVELLVVIVVIGVLAAISLVSYTGISQKAIAASVQSNLSSASGLLKLYQTEFGFYPTDFDGNLCPTLPTASTQYCLRTSSGNTFDLAAYKTSVSNATNPQTFILKSTSGSTTFQVTNDTAPTQVTNAIALSNANGGNWTKKAPITITNFQSNFQTLLTVAYSSAMKSDFSDIRFYDATSSTELPYWIESYTSSTTASVWVKTGTNNNIQLYYGNSSAISSTNGVNTFAFFDDFSGASFSPKWTQGGAGGGATLTQGSGLLTLFAPKAGNGYTSYSSTVPVSGASVARFRKMMNPNSGVSWVNINEATYQMSTTDCINSELRIGPTSGDCGVSPVSPRTDDNAWHTIDISYTNTAASLYIDGVLKQTLSSSFNSSSVTIGGGISNASWKGANGTLQLDYAFIRSYAVTGPTCSIGSEVSL